MKMIRYHKASGAIAAITSGRVEPIADEAFGTITGEADPARHWIDDGQIVEREPWAGVTGPALICGDGGVEVATGLPALSWCQIGCDYVQADELGRVEYEAPRLQRYWLRLAGRYTADAVKFEALSLDDIKQRQRDAVNNYRASIVVMDWNGHRWDIGEASLTAIGTRSVLVSAGVELPTGFTWTDADNNQVAMNAVGLMQLAQAMMNFKQSVHNHAQTLKVQIDSASSVADVLAISVGDGWPA